MMGKARKCRILLVGLGPAGLGFLLRLTDRCPELGASIVAVDRGPSLSQRLALKRTTMDRGELTQGFGGAGLFSDGKLCLSLSVGGKLHEVLSKKQQHVLEQEVESLFVQFDGTSHITQPNESLFASRFKSRGLEYTPYPVRHFGTDQLGIINQRMHAVLERRGIRVKCETELKTLSPVTNGWRACFSSRGGGWEDVYDKVVLAVGKRGSRWLRELGDELGIEFEMQPIRFGIRIEAPRNTMKEVAALGGDPKVFVRDAGLKTKLHCFCDGGEMLALDYDGVRVLGGHSLDESKTQWTNVGVLTEVWPRSGHTSNECATELLRPFSEMAGRGIFGEPLARFMGGAVVGSHWQAGSLNRSAVTLRRLQTLFPPDVYGRICDFVTRLSQAIGGSWIEQANAYGPAIEWWYDTVRVEARTMETSRRGIFAIGDGAGWSQGIVHAAATAVRAADALCEDLSQP